MSNESSQDRRYVSDFNTGVIARDGIRLATLVHRIDTESPKDTIAIRTPYGAIGMFQIVKLLKQGLESEFNYVLQDCRGRYNSDGEFDLLNETNDTLDTLDWIAFQPWSNGKVHLFGPSYMGWIALQVLQKQNQTKADIVSIFAPMTFIDPLDNAIYSDGVLNLHHSYPYAIMMSGKVQGPLNYLNTAFPEAYSIALSKGVAHQGYPTKIWDLIMDRERLGKLTISCTLDSSLNTKVTLVASYYDNVCRGTLKSFEKIAKIGGAQPNLVIGPWGHNGYLQSLDSVGKFRIANAQANVTQHLNEHFKALQKQELSSSRIRVYILRRDEWIESSTWPIEGEEREFVFPIQGKEIAADLSNPVPTLGGPVWDNVLVEGLNPGPHDQREINQRDDILKVYSEPFEKDTSFVGNINVEVDAKASKASSHITGKLCIADSENAEYIIQNGIHVIKDLEYGKRGINLDFSAFEVRVGERLMLEISWTNYPRYALPPSDYTLFLGEQGIRLRMKRYCGN